MSKENDPLEMWSEVCRRADDEVASSSSDRVGSTMLEWAQTLTQVSRQLAGVACQSCEGAGVKTYGSTATWRKGAIGGRMITQDICDVCWGTGRSDEQGIDLRALETPKLETEQKPQLLTWVKTLKEAKAKQRLTGWVAVRIRDRVEIRRGNGATFLIVVTRLAVSISSNAQFDFTAKSAAEILLVIEEALAHLEEVGRG